MEPAGHELFSYNELCKLSPDQMQTYKALLETFKEVHRQGSSATTAEKGSALEKLVTYLLRISGGIFTVKQNVKTGSSESDQVIKLNEKRAMLKAHGLIPSRLGYFLGECKNYNSKIGVTYIGKFYSLLQTTQINTGILFSYYGVTGKGWSDASGLIKKMYLQREHETNRVAIVSFNIDDFEAILSGDNFFRILEDKLDALQLDTNVVRYISHHSAESLIISL